MCFQHCDIFIPVPTMQYMYNTPLLPRLNHTKISFLNRKATGSNPLSTYKFWKSYIGYDVYIKGRSVKGWK